MIKGTSRLVMTAAAASLALVPIAATANTRAADSTATYSAPAEGRNTKGEKLVSPGILAAILAAAAAAGAIVVLADQDDDNYGQSPGAN